MKYRKWAACLLGVVLTLASLASGCGADARQGAAKGSSDVAGQSGAGQIKTESVQGDSSVTSDSGSGTNEPSKRDGAGSTTNASLEDAPKLNGLTCESVMELRYAKNFNVFYYQNGFKVIKSNQSGTYLVVPEGGTAPEGASETMTVIHQPLRQIYLAATGAMTFFDHLGAIDVVTMTGTDAPGWTIQAAVDAIQAGRMTFAGKYSSPDYETLVKKNCDLALESGMISHAPEVQEMLEDLGIPVLIDRSSYEQDPLGRAEWVKMYGALLNQEEKAQQLFSDQEARLAEMPKNSDTGKTVAFFSINSEGNVSVRKPKDVVAQMIDLAGGRYVCDDLQTDDKAATTTVISMEEFYSRAIDADYLIYNGTIEQGLSSIKDLTDKNELFSQFKAVRQGNVWQVGKDWYQSTLTGSDLATDFGRLLSGKEDGMTFLSKVSA